MRTEQCQVVKCTEACSGGPGLCNSCRPAGPQCPLSLAVTVASQSVLDHHAVVRRPISSLHSVAVVPYAGKSYKRYCLTHANYFIGVYDACLCVYDSRQNDGILVITRVTLYWHLEGIGIR